MSGHLDKFMHLSKSDARYQADESYDFQLPFFPGMS
jgi:hypothetical protein